MDKNETRLVDLIDRGGIFGNIGGATPREVLAGLSAALPAIPSVPGHKLLEAVMEREALMPTGIGKGIALPHPRNPIVSDEKAQFAAIAFLEKPVNWNSPDDEPVHTLILIVSASAKLHLQTLSQINYFCSQDDFCLLLKKRAGKEELLNFISEAEKNWE